VFWGVMLVVMLGSLQSVILRPTTLPTCTFVTLSRTALSRP
jgi:hypothetical protein